MLYGMFSLSAINEPIPYNEQKDFDLDKSIDKHFTTAWKSLSQML
jgi:hypothetical protein